MQVDATVWSNKCHSSLKLVLSTLLSFSLLPHSHSLTFNQHSAGSLTHSNFTFPFSLPTFPPHFLTHTISLLTISHPPQLHFLDWLPTLHFPHGGPLICRLFSSSMWEVLFSRICYQYVLDVFPTSIGLLLILSCREYYNKLFTSIVTSIVCMYTVYGM